MNYEGSSEQRLFAQTGVQCLAALHRGNGIRIVIISSCVAELLPML